MEKYEMSPYVEHPKKDAKKLVHKYHKLIKHKKSPVDSLLIHQNSNQNVLTDIPDEMRIPFDNGGVYFGLDASEKTKSYPHYIGKHQQEDGHILIVGSPGCHKTTGIILPSILTWRGTFVAVDVKGDISDFCIQHSSKIGYPIRILDFSGDNAWHYDPFLQLRTGGEDELISNARDIAFAIIPTPNNTKEPFWIQGAQNILTAIILYAFGHGMSFNEMIQMALTTPAEEIQNAIEGSGNECAPSLRQSRRVDAFNDR